MKDHRSLLCLLLMAIACGADKVEVRTSEEFCQAWASAACSAEVISVCQSAGAEECRQSQEDFCRTLVPAKTFSDANGDACIDAVKAAYLDADLTSTELATVLKLAAPCDTIIKGPKQVGEVCSDGSECDASAGFECVKKADTGRGTCQMPEEVAAGRDCEAAQKTCTKGFYCDGSNCVEANEVGDDCKIQEECDATGYCNEGKCSERLAVAEPCSFDEQCSTGICYAYAGTKSCTDRVRLARSEPLCADLR